MIHQSLRTAAVAAGAALLACGAFAFTQAPAVAVHAGDGRERPEPRRTRPATTPCTVTRMGPKQIQAGEEFTYELEADQCLRRADPRHPRHGDHPQGVELRSANADEAATVESGDRMTFNAGQLAAGDSAAPIKVTARAAETGERPQLHRGRLTTPPSAPSTT